MANQEDTLNYARKYRPKNLSDYIGNSKLKESILNAINSPVRPQVILLHGESGCGKTTMARIIAKEYSCTNRDVIKGACNECENCRLINDYIETGDEKRLSMIREENIADHNGKGDLEGILEEMSIPTYGDEWRIFIFDEVHMATNQLQNQLLKIVEEPPARVLMIFCTTNPDKLLDTLLNRCQLRLRVNKPDLRELSGLLIKICKQEGVEFDKTGIELIGKHADFTIRTALQNLQQVVIDHGNAHYESVADTFGTISNSLVMDFFKSLIDEDTLKYVTLLSQIKAKMNLSSFLSILRDFIKRGLYALNGIELEGIAATEYKAYQTLFMRLEVGQIATLLTKLSSFDDKNVEMQFLTLGYTGINPQVLSSNVVEETIANKMTDNELAKEVSNAISEQLNKENMAEEEGIQNAKEQMKGMSVIELMQLGATVVDNG